MESGGSEGASSTALLMSCWDCHLSDLSLLLARAGTGGGAESAGISRAESSEWSAAPDPGAMFDASQRLRSSSLHCRVAASSPGRQCHPMPLCRPDPASPTGIRDMTQWGRALISFGKFKGKRGLRPSTKSDDRQYKTCHYAQGLPQLRDLVDYLKKMRDEAAVAMTAHQNVAIASTCISRRVIVN